MKKRNYFGFDHDKVKTMFEGNPEYIGDCRITNPSGSIALVAVYHSPNPNREKGHKDYMLLTREWVSGMDLDKFKEHAEMSAVKCLACEEVLVSLHRHDYITCSCENGTMIDGGGDYERRGGKSLALVQRGIYNLLTDTFRVEEEKK